MKQFLEAVPLIGTIFGIIVSMLTISKFFRENGFFQAILTLSITVLPILFLQQIIIFTNDYYLKVTGWTFVITLVYLTVCILRKMNALRFNTIKNIAEKIPYDELVICTSVFILMACAFSLLSYKGYNELMNIDVAFMEELRTYKITPEMFQYLISNSAATLLYFTRFLQVVFIVIFLISYIFHFLTEGITLGLQKQLFVYSILSVLLSIGVICHLYITVYHLFK